MRVSLLPPGFACASRFMHWKRITSSHHQLSLQIGEFT
jgi:hypothetical protein